MVLLFSTANFAVIATTCGTVVAIAILIVATTTVVGLVGVPVYPIAFVIISA